MRPALRKSSGNMYGWVTHTFSHLGGECPHGCAYCYVRHFRRRAPEKYSGFLRLLPGCLDVNFGRGRTIFIENCHDLFAAPVPDHLINAVLDHCFSYLNNSYVFQTKNPGRYFQFLERIPRDSCLGTTLESNLFAAPLMGSAPPPLDRAIAMQQLYLEKQIYGFKLFVSIEPILQFTLPDFAEWLRGLHPDFITIGADSKHHHLLEPSADQIVALIAALRQITPDLRLKPNLNRLLPEPTR